MAAHEPIRILVVDDDELVRRGVRNVLSAVPDIQVVGEADNGQKAVDLSRRLRPDVVLMDLKLPELDGVMATGLIRRELPSVRILIMTAFNDRDIVSSALQAGASGFLIKGRFQGDTLRRTIRDAMSQSPVLAPEAIMSALVAVFGEKPPPLGHDLSSRERQVLGLLVQGSKNSEIARALEITEATVAAHVTSILRKLDVCNRSHAVALALIHHLVPPEENWRSKLEV